MTTGKGSCGTGLAAFAIRTGLTLIGQAIARRLERRQTARTCRCTRKGCAQPGGACRSGDCAATRG